MIKNKCILGIWLLLLLVVLNQSAKAQDKVLPVIPAPSAMKMQEGKFVIDPTILVIRDSAIKADNLVFFNQYLKDLADIELTTIVTNDASATSNTPVKNHTISLKLDAVAIPEKEGYTLKVSAGQILLTGHDAAGAFYGLQTLVQLMQKTKDGKIEIPACSINDYPRFSYRGMHLDVSRHAFPVAFLKKWIDMLALYKVNTFHWHLTDDQGWRIEIKQYPALQTISSLRAETIIGHKRYDPHRFDGKSYGGYYSQQEVKEIVKYATERHITVIPEIEMPGHAQAALAAYPALGCTDGPYQTATYWGVFDDVYCAGKEQTFSFLEHVLDEVLTLFPSAYIHIGGDECPKTQWKVCPACQERIRKEHLKDEHELQSYFIRRMEKYLESKGRKIIGWDEILEGGLAPSATVMSWRGLEGGIAAAKMHHDVIMTPEKYVYLDYYQSLYGGEQLAAGGYTPLSKVYGYEPVPEELNAEEAKYIKGVQANAWSEYLSSPEKAEYMLFPRMFALAEIAWTRKDIRNYPDFLKRLRRQENMLAVLNINRFRYYDEITSMKSLKNGKPELTLHTDMPGGVIRYTTNGKTPEPTSPIYTTPIIISQTGEIRAAVFGEGSDPARVFKQQFVYSKSTGKKITLFKKTAVNFTPENPRALLNGIQGSPFYNDGEWTGFSGDDLEVLIDLEQQTQISALGINILKYHWQKMWEPDVIRFEISDDGKKYTEVYRQNTFTAEGVNKVRANISPLKARYIRVTAVNKGVIPEGEYGAGGKAMLLADEILVN